MIDPQLAALLTWTHVAMVPYRHNPALRPGRVAVLQLPGVEVRVSHIIDERQDFLVANGLPLSTKLITQNLRNPMARHTPWIETDPDHRDLSWWLPEGRQGTWLGEVRSFLNEDDQFTCSLTIFKPGLERISP